MKQIKANTPKIDKQLFSNVKSGNILDDLFSRIVDSEPVDQYHKILNAYVIDTKLGPMIAIADEEKLYLLEFIDRRGLEKEIIILKIKLKATIIHGETSIIKNIATEIKNYFAGKNIKFETPLHLMGSIFQKKVWNELRKIPAAETRSYLEIAKSLFSPTACRAVGRANGMNQLAIIIPCHRVINANGELGGYAGGISRKQWLLNHEKQQNAY